MNAFRDLVPTWLSCENVHWASTDVVFCTWTIFQSRSNKYYDELYWLLRTSRVFILFVWFGHEMQVRSIEKSPFPSTRLR